MTTRLTLAPLPDADSAAGFLHFAPFHVVLLGPPADASSWLLSAFECGPERLHLAIDVAPSAVRWPAGCSMQLDRVATNIVLDNLKSAIPSRRSAMLRELRALADGRPSGATHRITLPEFLRETGLEFAGRAVRTSDLSPHAERT
jgi:hypothetical protein